ncbi:MAG: C45 family autoproteolytic acyltransferase/hydrolase [Phycisphaerales bacterium]
MSGLPLQPQSVISTCLLRGAPGDQGFAHGAAVADLLMPEPRVRYLDAVAELTGVDHGRSLVGAEAWFAALPAHVQEEIDGMARGASRAPGFTGPVLSALDVAHWLYADIAGGRGAACSALTVEIDRRAWVARNCDWLPAQLLRGHTVVVHDHPPSSSRIPILALGIRGDIDIDTGMNAAGLWLHVHTMHTPDAPSAAKPAISWLFWAREALETCETIDDVDALLHQFNRDRGVILVVVDAKTNERAVFECACSSHERHDAGLSFQCATNHPARKHPVDARRLAVSRVGGTVARRAAVETIAGGHHEWTPPDDLFAILGHPDVEMRTSTRMRTIYAAVCCPASRDIWLCPGSPGAPVADRDNARAPWTRIETPW